MKLYECGICDHLHPWDWYGDCREDATRYAGEDDYKERTGDTEEPDVRTWAERIRADLES